MIGVDRLDDSKGLSRRLDAFDMFLANRSDWVGKVTYLPMRQKPISDTRIRRTGGPPFPRPAASTASTAKCHAPRSATSIASTADRHWQGSIATARVGLVTPLRDGMNLVARSMSPLRTRTIRGFSCCPGLPARRSICGGHFWSIRMMRKSVANALAQALAMPLEERRARHQALLAVVSDYDVERWQREFLTALRSENGSSHELQNMPAIPAVPSGRPASLYPGRIGGLESRG